MIRKHGAALQSRGILPFLICLAFAAAFLATVGPASAQSAGCIAVGTGGATNATIPAGTVVNTVIAVNLEPGDTLTVTVTGNPNSIRIGTNPGNVRLFSGPGNQTGTITLTSAVTGITVSGQASGGQATLVTATCAGGTTATGDETETGQTPEETSDAADAAGDAIDSGRLPTSPAALPTASGAGGSFDDPFAGDKARVEELDAEIGIRDQIAALDAEIEELEQIGLRQSALLAAVSSGMRQFGDRDPIDPANAPDLNEQELQADVSATSQQVEELKEQRADLESQTSGRPKRALESERSQIEDRIEQGQDILDPDLADSDIILFRPGSDARSFTFEASSEALLRFAALRLDDGTVDPNVGMPPLTIAGMPVNIWIRGRGTVFDRQKRAGSDGWSAHLLSGLALRVGERLVVGGYGSYLAGESDAKATGTEVKSTSAGGGAYARIRLVDSVSAGLSIARETGEQDIKTATATGSADTGLWSISGSLAGSWAVAPVILSPSLSVTYADFERDGYTDSTGTAIPGSRSRDTTIAGALTVSRTYTYDDGWVRRASPRLNATLNYFAREDDTVRLSATEVIDRENWGGNVGAGVTLLTSGDSRLSFDAGVIGIGQDTLGYTGQLQVEFGF